MKELATLEAVLIVRPTPLPAPVAVQPVPQPIPQPVTIEPALTVHYLDEIEWLIQVEPTTDWPGEASIDIVAVSVHVFDG